MPHVNVSDPLSWIDLRDRFFAIRPKPVALASQRSAQGSEVSAIYKPSITRSRSSGPVSDVSQTKNIAPMTAVIVIDRSALLSIEVALRVLVVMGGSAFTSGRLYGDVATSSVRGPRGALIALRIAEPLEPDRRSPCGMTCASLYACL